MSRISVAIMFTRMYPVTAIGLPLWVPVLAVAYYTRAWWIIAVYSILYGIAGILEDSRADSRGWTA